MVKIPELKSAFCGCSVRTGSKVIGWLTMILGILEFIMFVAVIGLLATALSSTDDEELGKDTLSQLHKLELNDFEQGNGMENMDSLKTLLVSMIGNADTTDPEAVGRKIRIQLNVIFSVLFFVILVIFLVHTLFTTIFLVGVYKNKLGFIMFYLIICVLGLIGYIPLIFKGYASIIWQISTITGFLLHLYFTWVIYSFYRELRYTRHYKHQSDAMLMPEQGKDSKVFPFAVPNDYYYPNK